MKNITVDTLKSSLKNVFNFIEKHHEQLPPADITRAEFVSLYSEYEYIYNKLIEDGYSHDDLIDCMPRMRVEKKEQFVNWWQSCLAGRQEGKAN